MLRVFNTCYRDRARTCNFCDGCKTILLRDCIVRGVRSLTVRKKLLLEDKLTLEKAVLSCQAAEIADIHQQELEGTAMYHVKDP